MCRAIALNRVVRPVRRPSLPCVHRRLLSWLLIALILVVHGEALQIVAWTGMIVSRSAAVGFQQAAASTFDGSTPCRMCTAAAEVRRSAEGQQPAGVPPSDEQKAPKQFLMHPDPLVRLPLLAAATHAGRNTVGVSLDGVVPEPDPPRPRPI